MVRKSTRKHSNKQRKKTKINAKNIKNCCSVTSKRVKKCIRKSDGILFQLPRRFSRKKCKNKKQIKGFTMRSSCAPYKDS